VAFSEGIWGGKELSDKKDREFFYLNQKNFFSSMQKSRKFIKSQFNKLFSFTVSPSFPNSLVYSIHT